ncbi:hypothetical protein [Microbulbifer donghaiensis]|nr:hypothetical protein [Microbulbifer donghaiensis]
MEKELMEVFISHQWITIPVFIVLVIGVTLCWFGGLVAALTALGNKRWLWGIVSIVLGPITGLPYALIYREAEYAKSLMLKGLALLLGGLLAACVVWLAYR